MQIGDSVQITTDKAYKYHGCRFYIIDIDKKLGVLVGRKKDDLCDIWYDSRIAEREIKVVPPGQNKAIYPDFD